jgi:hypothetical protein
MLPMLVTVVAVEGPLCSQFLFAKVELMNSSRPDDDFLFMPSRRGVLAASFTEELRIGMSLLVVDRSEAVYCEGLCCWCAFRSRARLAAASRCTCFIRSTSFLVILLSPKASAMFSWLALLWCRCGGESETDLDFLGEGEWFDGLKHDMFPSVCVLGSGGPMG